MYSDFIVLKMDLLINALNKNKVKKVLSTKPWEEGFSLVELVVVIAVLAILSAVAIPAFQGVQARAKTSAVKNGMVNGVKECIVSDGLDLGTTFAKSKAFAGSYTGFTVRKRQNTIDSCYKVEAIPDAGQPFGYFVLEYDATTGVSTKICDANYDIGCTNGKW